MRWFFIIILSWAWAFTNAQDQSMMGDAAEQNLRTLGSHGSNDQIRTFSNRYEGVRGSPFLRDLWHHAVIITTKGDSLLTYIKLDIYSDDVWAILSRGDSIVVDKGLIRSLSFFDEASGRQRTFFFDQHQLGYFELLFKGNKLSLACKWKKELLKAVISGGYPSGNPYDEFTGAKSKYYVIKKNKLHLLRARRSTLQELLGKDAAKAFREREIDIRNEEQLIDMIQYADAHQ